MEYVKKCFWLYFSFKGRANRKEFWSFMFFVFTVSLGLVFLEMLISPDTVFFSALGGAPLAVWYIFCFFPILSVSVRRLHDIDLSAWWMLLALLPVFHVILILFYLLPGSNRANNYGEQPLKDYRFALNQI